MCVQYRNHRKRHSPDTSTAHRVCPVVQLPACVPAYTDVVYLLLSKKDAALLSQRSVAALQTRVLADGDGGAGGDHIVVEDRARDDMVAVITRLNARMMRTANRTPDRLKLHHILGPPGWTGSIGRINNDMIKTQLPNPSEQGHHPSLRARTNNQLRDEA